MCVCVCICSYVHLVTHHTQMTILSNTRKTTATDTDMATTAVMAVKQEQKRNTNGSFHSFHMKQSLGIRLLH